LDPKVPFSPGLPSLPGVPAMPKSPCEHPNILITLVAHTKFALVTVNTHHTTPNSVPSRQNVHTSLGRLNCGKRKLYKHQL
jgi:hypothetical protein